jgi:type I restriction enzyme M protein
MPSLSNTALRSLQKAIRKLDPDERFVRLDIAARQVRYCTEIVQHEAIRDYSGDEEPVRAYIVAWLCTAGGYPANAIELERRYNFGRKGGIELDVRIAREGKPDSAYALVEIKSPHDFGGETDSRIEGQLFAPAGSSEPECSLLSLATVSIGADGKIAIETVTIAYEPTLSYSRWVKAGRPHVDDFPVSYNAPTQQPYVPKPDGDPPKTNGEPRKTGRYLREDVDFAELERLRRQLHDRLWGGSRDDNQIYAWLVRLFIAKIYDEKETDPEKPYHFQVLHEGPHRESPAATLKKVNERYVEAYERYLTDKMERIEPLDESLFSAQELQWVVERLQAISLTAAGKATGDVLGSFFEGITREGFKQSKGLFFTHYNLATFMLEVLEVGQLAERKLGSNARPEDRLPYIVDPSCGSGTFLHAAMRLVTQHIQSHRSRLARSREARKQLELYFPENSPNTSPNNWAKDFIYGIEKREDLALSTKVNMVLHRDGDPHVYRDDALAPLEALAERHKAEKLRPRANPDDIYPKPVAETFDVIATNPPFSLTLDDDVRTSLQETFELASDRNSENLFLERWYQLLKPQGRLAAVLPESFFSTSENLSARLFLLARFNIRAIVSVPTHAFQPWTPTRTSLLFAQKKTRAEERTWVIAFRRHRQDVAASVRSAQIAARGILRPRKDATEEQLVGHLEALDRALDELGLAVEEPDGPDGSARWAQTALEAVNAINVDAEAFARTVNEVDGERYFGVIVREIGYRRTKRAENAARNELFKAVAEDEEGVRTIVRNLNDAPESWRIEISEDGPDALSRIRAEVRWH